VYPVLELREKKWTIVKVKGGKVDCFSPCVDPNPQRKQKKLSFSNLGDPYLFGKMVWDYLHHLLPSFIIFEVI